MDYVKELNSMVPRNLVFFQYLGVSYSSLAYASHLHPTAYRGIIPHIVVVDITKSEPHEEWI